jgi:hypothetical protein
MQRTNWETFKETFRRTWKLGEHVSVVGPTGSGKSFLCLELIKTREYAVLFLTKARDETASTFIARNHYEQIAKWPPKDNDKHIALWPRFVNVDSYDTQETVFRNAINGERGKGLTKPEIQGIFSEGVWSILIDEVMYFTEDIHLGKELKMLWGQGRSNHISLIGGTQRPFDVPQMMLNQWTHFFCFHTPDERELRRLGEMGGLGGKMAREEVPKLKEHEFLYLNKKTPALNCISKVRR